MCGGSPAYSSCWPAVRYDHRPRGLGTRESAWHVCAPMRTSSIKLRPQRGQHFFRPPKAQRKTPARAACPSPPPAVSLFSDVTRRPRPSPPTFPPHLRFSRLVAKQPPTTRQCRAPPAARPGLRPLALFPTCLCYSSSLPRLASDTAAACKTRSTEFSPHLDCLAGSGPSLPRLPWRGVRACALFQPRRLLFSRLEFLESGGGFEERMWKSKRICVREREMKCTGVCLVVFVFF